MAINKDEEIKVRVPKALKRGIKAVADARFTSESEIMREAIIGYLQSRGLLREESPSYKTNSVAAAPTVDAALKLAKVVNPLASYSKSHPRPATKRPTTPPAAPSKVPQNPAKSPVSDP